MQQVEELTELGPTEQKQVNKVVEVLSTLASRGENLAEIAHDARNMVTALDLYCDLLQVPGVLGTSFAHYGGELRLVAAASRRLVEKLVTLGSTGAPANAEISKDSVFPELWPASAQKTKPQQWKNVPAEQIENLAEELFAIAAFWRPLLDPPLH